MQLLQEHMIITQNQRPEFVFHLIMMYFKQKKYQKVL